MGELIRINQVDITAMEYRGQRVVTFDMIDQVHERPAGTARKNFNRNKKHFREGEYYFVLLMDEAKLIDITAPNGLTIITQSGYLRLVKTFRDDLAWDIHGDVMPNICLHVTVPESSEALTRPLSQDVSGRLLLLLSEARTLALSMQCQVLLTFYGYTLAVAPDDNLPALYQKYLRFLGKEENDAWSPI